VEEAAGDAQFAQACCGEVEGVPLGNRAKVQRAAFCVTPQPGGAGIGIEQEMMHSLRRAWRERGSRAVAEPPGLHQGTDGRVKDAAGSLVDSRGGLKELHGERVDADGFAAGARRGVDPADGASRTEETQAVFTCFHFDSGFFRGGFQEGAGRSCEDELIASAHRFKAGPEDWGFVWHAAGEYGPLEV
jgi:hypothetical protein